MDLDPLTQFYKVIILYSYKNWNLPGVHYIYIYPLVIKRSGYT